jgi:two-component system CheB/CheR fusion protein
MPQLRILVADDDRDAVASLLELLRDEGHEVRGVYSGLAVLDKVRDFGPDVVLLDIGMPQVNGYEVARALRQRYGSARPLLIAVTGHNEPQDRTLSQLAGFDHHLAKPYDPDQLFALLVASAGATRSPAAPETPDPAGPRGRPANR